MYEMQEEWGFLKFFCKDFHCNYHMMQLMMNCGTTEDIKIIFYGMEIHKKQKMFS